MSTIYLLNYENYYNRKCGPPQTNVINYEDYVLAEYDNINFNPNDGVNTELVVNYDGTHPNYLLVVDDYPIVASRWYVIECQRTRAGQLRLVLRKDLVADFYDYVLDAPAMIERGRLGKYDPYIFNDEGMRFNQIKQSETLLKDKTQIPWVIGYMAKVQTETTPTYISITQPQSFDYTGSSITVWGPSGGTTGLNLGYYTNQNAQKSTNGVKYTHSIYASSSIGIYNTFTYGAATNYKLKAEGGGVTQPSLYYPGATYTELQYQKYLERAFDSQIDSLNTAANSVIVTNDTMISTLQQQEGKIVKIGENKYYRIHVVSQQFTNEVNVTNTGEATYFWRMSQFCLNTPIDEVYNLFSGSASDNSFKLKAVGTQYYLALEELTNQINFTIPTTRRVLTDAPYSMFAIPYGSVAITSGDQLYIRLGSEGIATQVAAAISEKMGSQVYDVQLLPYCPLRRAITQTNGVGFAQLTEGADYTLITQTIDDNTSTIGFMFWVEESEFTFNIDTLQVVPYDTKTTNQCISNRLCSPNYSSVYEFNIAKNGGISGFNVDCAYKPYSPYIHIWPKGGIHSIYGEDFNDPRGLICSGDFSMTTTCDQWALYEINNKNYQNMFNRQIETMDLTHKIQRTEQILGASVGAIQGGISGANTGAMIGGGYGAIAGAVVGTAVSGVGGIMDVVHSQQLRENERQQAFDMFRMGNENIQSMPDTLTKVSAFTPNNKIFPVYETYSATEQEITAFQDYIKYRGMTVGRIDNISNFIWPDWEFVQASIIRFDDFAEDSHVAYEINNELMKGVYLKQ